MADLVEFAKTKSFNSNREVDAFVEKVDAVSKAIEGIMKGTLKEEDINIPGYKTKKQIEQEEVARKKRIKEREEMKAKEKENERIQWWKRAELLLSCQEITPKTSSDEELMNRVVASYKKRDANDYSQWDKWEALTIEEQKDREDMIEKLKNKQFEELNKDFCQQFKDDLEQRNKQKEEKQKIAEKYKNQGNLSFKKKSYEKSVEYYMKALEETPHNVSLLTNLAQSYLRLEKLEDTLEFCNRALYLFPHTLKALSRRAVVYTLKNDFEKALIDLNKALEFAPENTKEREDLEKQKQEVELLYEEKKAEERLEQEIETDIYLQQFKEIIDKMKKEEELLNENTLSEIKQESSKDKLATAKEGIKSILLDENAVLTRVEEAATEAANRTTKNSKNDDVESALNYVLMKNLLECSDSCKVLLRTSGFLVKLRDDFLNYSRNDKLNEDLLHVLFCACIKERRNKEILYSENFFIYLTSILQKTVKDKDKSSHNSLKYKVLLFLEECIDVNLWKESLLDSNEFISSILLLTKEEQNLERKETCLSLLNTCATAEKGMQHLRKHEVVKILLELLLNYKRKNSLPETSLRNSVLRCLANIFRDQFMRENIVRNDSDRKTTIEQLIQLLNYKISNKEEIENILAVLLNLSFQGEEFCKDDFFSFGIISLLLSILKAENSLSVISNRALGLLLRCSSLSSCISQLDEKETIIFLLNQLESSTVSSSSSKNYLLRLIILLLEKKSSLLMQQLNVKNGFLPFLSLLSTPELVINTTKFFIYLMDNPSEYLIQDFLKFKAIEALINLLKELPDGTARKNCAILLAKCCRNPEMKKIIQKLRGIEMLTSLSKQLIR